MTKKMEEIISKMDQTSQMHCSAAVEFYKEYEKSKFYRNLYGKNCKPNTKVEDALALMDIGKIYIAQYILDKGPELTEHERKEISMHGYNAYRFLKDEGIGNGIPEILLIHTGEEQAKEIFASQEEGKTFPRLSKSIREDAKTVYTLDSYIGMIQRRTYRPPFTPEAALANLRKQDEEIVDENIMKYIDAKIREERAMAY